MLRRALLALARRMLSARDQQERAAPERWGLVEWVRRVLAVQDRQAFALQVILVSPAPAHRALVVRDLQGLEAPVPRAEAARTYRGLVHHERCHRLRATVMPAARARVEVREQAPAAAALRAMAWREAARQHRQFLDPQLGPALPPMGDTSLPRLTMAAPVLPRDPTMEEGPQAQAAPQRRAHRAAEVLLSARQATMAPAPPFKDREVPTPALRAITAPILPCRDREALLLAHSPSWAAAPDRNPSWAAVPVRKRRGEQRCRQTAAVLPMW
jgi:hypothetical protein